MQVIRTPSTLQPLIKAYKLASESVCFVPTMGALHPGHLSLIETAKQHGRRVIASIFVNPAQFAPHEDFHAYPRPEDQDIALLQESGVDIAYLPHVSDMYPDGFSTKLSVGDIGQTLCGVSRPHFFDGVALVITKLFHHVQPDVAVFGEKDFQQLHIINKLTQDLDFPVSIIGNPVVREADGLAISSRNRYLSHQERRIAANLYTTLEAIATSLNQLSPLDVDTIRNHAAKELLADGFTKIDYLEIRDEATLSHVTYPLEKPIRILGAAYLGTTRLIDNIRFLPKIHS
ncbi:MAG: pantoate--beta-alanine ligase [Alphaproteobacteria bacterium]|nr:pantoate--beta-alanine ligase [Alphaproteobacteria bacterium]